MGDREANALEHIGSELTAIRQNLEALVAFQEWRAGKYRDQRQGKLPAGFPGKLELEAAGIENVDDIPRSAKSLKQLLNGDARLATAILSQISTKQKETA